MPDATLSDPRTSLLDKDISSMTEDELRSFVQAIRATRNSQQLALENKRERKATNPKAASPSAKAKMMELLTGGDDDES